MIESLTLERFQALADAYGGVVARWPEKHRDDAMRMASQPAAREILAQASVLDRTLDAWSVPAPVPALGERVIFSALTPRRKIAARGRLWWSGIGIAATLAGATAGAATVAVAAPVDTASDGSTSFGDLGPRES